MCTPDGSPAQHRLHRPRNQSLPLLQHVAVGVRRQRCAPTIWAYLEIVLTYATKLREMMVDIDGALTYDHASAPPR